MRAKQQISALTTLVSREILRFSRIWIQTIVPPAVTMGLYFVIFGNLIGSQLDNVSGFRYIDYIVPGIILMAIINNAYANVVSSFYSTKFQRHIPCPGVKIHPNKSMARDINHNNP